MPRYRINYVVKTEGDINPEAWHEMDFGPGTKVLETTLSPLDPEFDVTMVNVETRQVESVRVHAEDTDAAATEALTDDHVLVSVEPTVPVLGAPAETPVPELPAVNE